MDRLKLEFEIHSLSRAHLNAAGIDRVIPGEGNYVDPEGRSIALVSSNELVVFREGDFELLRWRSP